MKKYNLIFDPIMKSGDVISNETVSYMKLEDESWTNISGEEAKIEIDNEYTLTGSLLLYDDKGIRLTLSSNKTILTKIL